MVQIDTYVIIALSKLASRRYIVQDIAYSKESLNNESNAIIVIIPSKRKEPQAIYLWKQLDCWITFWHHGNIALYY